jgi:hypothetical protein
LKKIIILIVTAAVIAGLIAAFLIIKNKPVQEAAAAEIPEEIIVLEMDPDTITEIRVTNPSGKLIFKKEGGLWGLPAAGDIEINTRTIESLAGSVSKIGADRIIDKKPADLSQFGLQIERAKIIVTTADGDTKTLLLGNNAPSGRTSYFKLAADPTVYTIPSFKARNFLMTMRDLRYTNIGTINTQNFSYLKIRDRRTIEIVTIGSGEIQLQNALSTVKLIQPYSQHRAANGEKLGAFLETVPPRIVIREFVEDYPKDLKQYGLDPPQKEIVLKDTESTFHLLLGNNSDNRDVYAQLAGKEGVFTLGRDQVQMFNVKPFDFADKFVLLINIDSVEGFEVVAGGRSYKGSIVRPLGPAAKDGEEIEPEYLFNGKKSETKPFKEFYQEIIGLLVEGENPKGPKELKAKPEMSVIYTLNLPGIPSARVDLVPFDGNFYEVYVDGLSEFLLGSYQVDEVIEKVNEMAAR